MAVIKKKVSIKFRRTLRFGLTAIVGLFIVFGLLFPLFRSPFVFQERISIVWATDPVWITTYHPKTGILGLIRVPSDTYVDVPGGFGPYKIGVLWKLGRLEKKKSNILASAVQHFLGVPIDGWVEIGEVPLSLDGKPDDVYSRLLSSLAPYSRNIVSLSSTISYVDRLVLWWKMRSVEPSDIVFVDLDKEQVLTETTLADDSSAMLGNPELVDKVSSRLFWEELMQQVQFVFHIYNGSNINRFGQQVARMLANIGIHVVGVTNSEPREDCQLRVPEYSQKDPGLQRISDLFECQIVVDVNLKQEANLYLSGRELNQFDLLY